MPRTRPLHPSLPASGRLPLHHMVADVSSALDTEEPGTLLRVAGDPLRLGYLPLDGQHPLDALLGFTAPQDWRAIGVHCRGRAYPIEHAGEEPQPVVITTLVDRAGQGAGLLRYLVSDPGAAGAAAGSDMVTRYEEAPDGVVGDACRRALGLPTPPPPPTTAELWLRLWLDRVVEAAAFSDGHDRYGTWNPVAALYPAALSPLLPGGSNDLAFDDPYALAEATLLLADTWTWARLRRDPEVLAATGPPISRRVAAWMDDGMFARVVLADLAPLPLLAHTTSTLLPVPVLEDINEVVLATGLRWSADSTAGPRR